MAGIPRCSILGHGRNARCAGTEIYQGSMPDAKMDSSVGDNDKLPVGNKLPVGEINKYLGYSRTIFEISSGSKEVPSKTERHPDNISGISTWLAETLPRSSMPGYKPSLEHVTPRLPPVSLLPMLVPTATRATQMLGFGRENQQQSTTWNTYLTSVSGETANKSIRKPRYGIVVKPSQP